MQPKKINIKLFYDNNAISYFYGKAVVYIAYIGKYNGEFIFKYGLSRKMFQRDYKEHSKRFDKFQVVLIEETDNCEQIESLFEEDLKVFKLHRTHKIGTKQTELFTVTIKYSIEYVIKHMKELVKLYPLPAIKEAEDKIEKLEMTINSHKQNNKIKELELQYKSSPNYKLELVNKKLELENRKLELENENEKEKTKQLKLKLELKKFKN